MDTTYRNHHAKHSQWRINGNSIRFFQICHWYDSISHVRLVAVTWMFCAKSRLEKNVAPPSRQGAASAGPRSTGLWWLTKSLILGTRPRFGNSDRNVSSRDVCCVQLQSAAILILSIVGDCICTSRYHHSYIELFTCFFCLCFREAARLVSRGAQLPRCSEGTGFPTTIRAPHRRW